MINKEYLIKIKGWIYLGVCVSNYFINNKEKYRYCFKNNNLTLNDKK